MSTSMQVAARQRIRREFDPRSRPTPDEYTRFTLSWAGVFRCNIPLIPIPSFYNVNYDVGNGGRRPSAFSLGRVSERSDREAMAQSFLNFLNRRYQTGHLGDAIAGLPAYRRIHDAMASLRSSYLTREQVLPTLEKIREELPLLHRAVLPYTDSSIPLQEMKQEVERLHDTYPIRITSAGLPFIHIQNCVVDFPEGDIQIECGHFYVSLPCLSNATAAHVFGIHPDPEWCTPLPSRNGVGSEMVNFHPHILEVTLSEISWSPTEVPRALDMCLGYELPTQIEGMLRVGALLEVAHSLRAALNSYNPESPYWSIQRVQAGLYEGVDPNIFDFLRPGPLPPPTPSQSATVGGYL